MCFRLQPVLLSRHHFVACRARLRLLASCPSIRSFPKPARYMWRRTAADRPPTTNRNSQCVNSEPGTKCTFYDALFKAPRLHHRALGYKLCEPISHLLCVLTSRRPVLFWLLESLTHSPVRLIFNGHQQQSGQNRTAAHVHCDLAGISHLIGRQRRPIAKDQDKMRKSNTGR